MEDYQLLPWPEVEKMNKATKRFINDLKRLFGPQNYRTHLVHILGTELAHVLTQDDWAQAMHVINNWLLVNMRGQGRDAEGRSNGAILQLVTVPEDQIIALRDALHDGGAAMLVATRLDPAASRH